MPCPPRRSASRHGRHITQLTPCPLSLEACNEGRTDDGVEQGGARLASEVRIAAAWMPRWTNIARTGELDEGQSQGMRPCRRAGAAVPVFGPRVPARA